MAQSEVGYIFPEDAAKQVVEVGNAIQKTDTALLKYTEDAQKLINLLKEQNISFEQLQKVQQKTAETTTKLDAIGKQLIQSEEKLKAVSDTRTEAIIRNRVETQKATQNIKDKIRAQNAEKGSIEQLSAVNAILEKRLKAVNLTTDEGRKKADLLRGAIDRNTKKIMDNSSAFSRWKINIGNYQSALETLSPRVAGLANQAKNVTTAIAGLGPVGGIVAGTIAASAAQLLVFFTKTEKGAEMFERKFAGMKAAVNVLIGELARGGEKLAENFEKQGQQSTFWTKAMSIFGTQGQLLGVQMDFASTAAENYTRKMQEVEDIERELIVPRAKANDAIAKATEIYNDSSKSMSIRMAALQSVIEQEDIIANKEIETQKKLTSALEERNKQAEIAGTLRDYQIKELEEARAKEIELDTASSLRTMRTKKRLDTARKEIIAQNKEISKAEEERAQKEKELSEKRVKLWAEETWAKQEAINDQKKADEELFNAIAEQIQKEQELRDAALDDEVEKSIAAGEKIFEERQRLVEKEREERKQNTQQTIDDAINLGRQLFDLRGQQLQREFEMAEGNAEKQAEINAKIARHQKAQALVDVAINTAIAVSKVWGQTGIFGLAAQIPVLAMGAIQAALIAGQKIPKFATGTDYAPAEFIAGEAGRELVRTKSGETYLAGKATHFKGNRFKGATVYTNKETEQIIKESGRGNNFVFDTKELRDEMRAVKKAIIKKPVLITDNSGRVIGKESNNYREIYLNRLRNGR